MGSKIRDKRIRYGLGLLILLSAIIVIVLPVDSDWHFLAGIVFITISIVSNIISLYLDRKY